MLHWTEGTIRLHTLYCHLAMLMMAIVLQRIRQAGLTVRFDRALERLQGIQETPVVGQDGRTDQPPRRDGPPPGGWGDEEPEPL